MGPTISAAHIDFWDELQSLMNFRLIRQYLTGSSSAQRQINQYLVTRFNGIRQQHERHQLHREIIERNRLRAEAADVIMLDDDPIAIQERIRLR